MVDPELGVWKARQHLRRLHLRAKRCGDPTLVAFGLELYGLLLAAHSPTILFKYLLWVLKNGGEQNELGGLRERAEEAYMAAMKVINADMVCSDVEDGQAWLDAANMACVAAAARLCFPYEVRDDNDFSHSAWWEKMSKRLAGAVGASPNFPDRRDFWVQRVLKDNHHVYSKLNEIGVYGWDVLPFAREQGEGKWYTKYPGAALLHIPATEIVNMLHASISHDLDPLR